MRRRTRCTRGSRWWRRARCLRKASVRLKLMRKTVRWRMLMEKRSHGCRTCSARHSQPLIQAHMEDSRFLGGLRRTAFHLWTTSS
uniref:Uncharacterized protein n=1 Tax=Arundo donax TaxID=35708 RepID=A0A0A9FFW6_ARUDO